MSSITMTTTGSPPIPGHSHLMWCGNTECGIEPHWCPSRPILDAGRLARVLHEEMDGTPWAGNPCGHTLMAARIAAAYAADREDDRGR